MSDNALVGFIHRTERYEEDFMKYGYSPLSLTMPSDRRNIRYYELTKSFLLENEMPFVLCDAGCGFGDVNGYLHEIGVSDYRYIGLDVVDSFLAEGEKRYGSDTIKYYKKDFTRDDLSEFSWDFAISSQTFNALYSTQEENYAMMFSSISRLFERCSERGGVSFNFVNDKGAWHKDGAAYYDPVRVLNFAYSLSKAVILDNSCMPFETTVTIFKNDGFRQSVFERYYKIHAKEFDTGLFKILKK